MKAFLTYLILGPFIGGTVLALFTMPVIAASGGLGEALGFGMLFIIFSPVFGLAPAIITAVLLRYCQKQKAGINLQLLSAKLGFTSSFSLALLVVGLNAISSNFPAALLELTATDAVRIFWVLLWSAGFGLLGLASGFICAKIAYPPSTRSNQQDADALLQAATLHLAVPPKE